MTKIAIILDIDTAAAALAAMRSHAYNFATHARKFPDSPMDWAAYVARLEREAAIFAAAYEAAEQVAPPQAGAPPQAVPE